jgi:hypothetical protein
MITSFPSRPVYNPGGYLSFKFIPSIYITGMPAPSNHVINTVITIVNAWLQGYATYETLLFTEEVIKSAHGESYRPTLTGFIPGESAELADLIYSMEQVKDFVLLITDNRGRIRVAGSDTMPLEFSASFSSGDERSSTKGYNFKFTGDALTRAPSYVL